MTTQTLQTQVFFSGNVQGVGFRYTTRRYALEIGLTGWVKNLPDGRVEAHLQGSQEQIDKLCDHLKKHYDGFIRSVDMTSFPSPETFSDFCIIH